jgi:hypothetical protein
MEISGYSSTRSAASESNRPMITVKTMSVDSNLHVGPLGRAIVLSTAGHAEPVSHG